MTRRALLQAGRSPPPNYDQAGHVDPRPPSVSVRLECLQISPLRPAAVSSRSRLLLQRWSRGTLSRQTPRAGRASPIRPNFKVALADLRLRCRRVTVSRHYGQGRAFKPPPRQSRPSSPACRAAAAAASASPSRGRPCRLELPMLRWPSPPPPAAQTRLRAACEPPSCLASAVSRPCRLCHKPPHLESSCPARRLSKPPPPLAWPSRRRDPPLPLHSATPAAVPLHRA